MFPARMFPGRMFPPRMFPKAAGGSTPPTPTPTSVFRKARIRIKRRG